MKKIWETEKDVIAGKKLIFENDEDLKSMEKKEENHVAQLSQKLGHLWQYVNIRLMNTLHNNVLTNK